MEQEVILTYETIYELVRREKSREELQKLDENYLRDVLSYLREKQRAYDDNLAKTDIFSQSERDKLHIQITNIKKLIKDLYDIRERKIINMSINHTRTQAHIMDTAHLVHHEKEIFDSMTTVMKRYRQGVLYKILEQREPDVLPVEIKAEPAAEKTHKTVTFLDNIEQFVDEDLNPYGPYQAQQQATLPKALADILLGQGKAIEQ